jgi:5-methylthioadenosine/S-adenosylhomocysteine deaminase
VRDVFVDGREVVRDGRIVTPDYEGAVRALRNAQARTCGGNV